MPTSIENFASQTLNGVSDDAIIQKTSRNAEPVTAKQPFFGRVVTFFRGNEANKQANEWLLGTLKASFNDAVGAQALAMARGETLTEGNGIDFDHNKATTVKDVRRAIAIAKSLTAEADRAYAQAFLQDPLQPYMDLSAAADKLGCSIGSLGDSEDARVAYKMLMNEYLASVPTERLQHMQDTLLMQGGEKPDTVKHVTRDFAAQSQKTIALLLSLKADSFDIIARSATSKSTQADTVAHTLAAKSGLGNADAESAKRDIGQLFGSYALLSNGDTKAVAKYRGDTPPYVVARRALSGGNMTEQQAKDLFDKAMSADGVGRSLLTDLRPWNGDEKAPVQIAAFLTALGEKAGYADAGIQVQKIFDPASITNEMNSTELRKLPDDRILRATFNGTKFQINGATSGNGPNAEENRIVAHAEIAKLAKQYGNDIAVKAFAAARGEKTFEVAAETGKPSHGVMFDQNRPVTAGQVAKSDEIAKVLDADTARTGLHDLLKTEGLVPSAEGWGDVKVRLFGDERMISDFEAERYTDLLERQIDSLPAGAIPKGADAVNYVRAIAEKTARSMIPRDNGRHLINIDGDIKKCTDAAKLTRNVLGGASYVLKNRPGLKNNHVEPIKAELDKFFAATADLPDTFHQDVAGDPNSMANRISVATAVMGDVSGEDARAIYDVVMGRRGAARMLLDHFQKAGDKDSWTNLSAYVQAVARRGGAELEWQAARDIGEWKSPEASSNMASASGGASPSAPVAPTTDQTEVVPESSLVAEEPVASSSAPPKPARVYTHNHEIFRNIDQLDASKTSDGEPIGAEEWVGKFKGIGERIKSVSNFNERTECIEALVTCMSNHPDRALDVSETVTGLISKIGLSPQSLGKLPKLVNAIAESYSAVANDSPEQHKKIVKDLALLLGAVSTVAERKGEATGLIGNAIDACHEQIVKHLPPADFAVTVDNMTEDNARGATRLGQAIGNGSGSDNDNAWMDHFEKSTRALRHLSADRHPELAHELERLVTLSAGKMLARDKPPSAGEVTFIQDCLTDQDASGATNNLRPTPLPASAQAAVVKEFLHALPKWLLTAPGNSMSLNEHELLAPITMLLGQKGPEAERDAYVAFAKGVVELKNSTGLQATVPSQFVRKLTDDLLEATTRPNREVTRSEYAAIQEAVHFLAKEDEPVTFVAQMSTAMDVRIKADPEDTSDGLSRAAIESIAETYKQKLTAPRENGMADPVAEDVRNLFNHIFSHAQQAESANALGALATSVPSMPVLTRGDAALKLLRANDGRNDLTPEQLANVASAIPHVDHELKLEFAKELISHIPDVLASNDNDLKDQYFNNIIEGLSSTIESMEQIDSFQAILRNTENMKGDDAARIAHLHSRAFNGLDPSMASALCGVMLDQRIDLSTRCTYASHLEQNAQGAEVDAGLKTLIDELRNSETGPNSGSTTLSPNALRTFDVELDLIARMTPQAAQAGFKEFIETAGLLDIATTKQDYAEVAKLHAKALKRLPVGAREDVLRSLCEKIALIKQTPGKGSEVADAYLDQLGEQLPIHAKLIFADRLAEKMVWAERKPEDLSQRLSWLAKTLTSLEESENKLEFLKAYVEQLEPQKAPAVPKREDVVKLQQALSGLTSHDKTIALVSLGDAAKKWPEVLCPLEIGLGRGTGWDLSKSFHKLIERISTGIKSMVTAFEPRLAPGKLNHLIDSALDNIENLNGESAASALNELLIHVSDAVGQLTVNGVRPDPLGKTGDRIVQLISKFENNNQMDKITATVGEIVKKNYTYWSPIETAVGQKVRQKLGATGGPSRQASKPQTPAASRADAAQFPLEGAQAAGASVHLVDNKRVNAMVAAYTSFGIEDRKRFESGGGPANLLRMLNELPNAREKSLFKEAAEAAEPGLQQKENEQINGLLALANGGRSSEMRQKSVTLFHKVICNRMSRAIVINDKKMFFDALKELTTAKDKFSTISDADLLSSELGPVINSLNGGRAIVKVFMTDCDDQTRKMIENTQYRPNDKREGMKSMAGYFSQCGIPIGNTAQ